MEYKRKKGISKDTCRSEYKTKEILALKVTDEKVHDSKVMKNLVESVLNNNLISRLNLHRMGAYDNNENSIFEGEKNSTLSSK